MSEELTLELQEEINATVHELTELVHSFSEEKLNSRIEMSRGSNLFIYAAVQGNRGVAIHLMGIAANAKKDHMFSDQVDSDIREYIIDHLIAPGSDVYVGFTPEQKAEALREVRSYFPEFREKKETK